MRRASTTFGLPVGLRIAPEFAVLLPRRNFYITYGLAGTARTLPTFVFSGIAVG